MSQPPDDAKVAKWCRENPHRPFCENDGIPCPMSDAGCPYRQVHLSYTRRFPDLYDRRQALTAVINGVIGVVVIGVGAIFILMMVGIFSHNH